MGRRLELLLHDYFLRIGILQGNLFNPDWTKGNLFEIENITNIFGPVLSFTISVVGFWIVGFSIFKNAISGLYCVFPDFFDKVDEIHNAIFIEGASKLTGAVFRGKAAGVGSFISMLLSYIPNVKSFTDFNGMDGAAIDKKQYFMRSLTMLVAQVFIGMLIFYGYPGEIANWIGTAGTQGISIVMDNTDPKEVVKELTGRMVSLDLSTDSSQLPFDKLVNKITKAAAGKVFSKYGKINKNSRNVIAAEIEGIVQRTLSPFIEVLSDVDGYNVSHDMALNSTKQTTMAGTGWGDVGGGVYQNTSSTGIISYRFWIHVPTLSTGVEVGQDDNIVVTVSATPIARDTSKYKSIEIWSTGARFDGNNVNTVKFSLPGEMTYANSGRISSGWGIVGVQGRTAVVSVGRVESGKLRFSATGSGVIKRSGDSFKITGIKWDGPVSATDFASPSFIVKIAGWKVDVTGSDAASSNTVTLSLQRFVLNNGVDGAKINGNKVTSAEQAYDLLSGKRVQSSGGTGSSSSGGTGSSSSDGTDSSSSDETDSSSSGGTVRSGPRRPPRWQITR